jgi:DNA-binding transcriptional LysR family regulator
MDQLKRMAVFAEVVAAGSLTAAAGRLGMTPSAVSQHLRQLEQALGLALMHRTTRRLTLTEAGERYREGCAAMVAAARAADHALARLRDEPEGELRLAAPIGLGGRLITALAPLRRHPRLSLTLLLDDSLIDLIQNRVDIALRVGTLPDSGLVARKIGSLGLQLCAAPAYLAARGWPQHPRDLVQHDWLGSRGSNPAGEVLELTGSHGEQETVRLQARVRANQISALHALCVQGWGIGVGVSDEDRTALADGRLMAVLPDWKMADLPVYAVTQRRTEQPAKVRHTLDLLQLGFGLSSGQRGTSTARS